MKDSTAACMGICGIRGKIRGRSGWQVDGFSTRIKPEPKDVEEDDEETIGDVDLFSLIKEKDELTVNAKWLQHLQVCTACRICIHYSLPSQLFN